MRIIGFIVGVCVGFNAYGVVVFDSQNLMQNILRVKQGTEQLTQGMEQLGQLKEQAKAMSHQLKIQKKQLSLKNDSLRLSKQNLKKLDFSTVKALKENFQKTRKLLKKNEGISKDLSKMDDAYNTAYGDVPGIVNLPAKEQHERTEAQLKQSLKSNQSAINALRVLGSFEQDAQNTEALVQHSQQAEGTLQAIQSSNQLSAIAIKNSQELKLLMARDVEQRSLALSQENINKQVAHQNNKKFWAAPKKIKKTNKKLPKLGDSSKKIL